MGSVSGTLASGGMVAPASSVVPQAGSITPGMVLGGRGIGPTTVIGHGQAPGLGLGFGSRQLLSTSGIRISQHGAEDVAGTPGIRLLGKM